MSSTVPMKRAPRNSVRPFISLRFLPFSANHRTTLAPRIPNRRLRTRVLHLLSAAETRADAASIRPRQFVAEADSLDSTKRTLAPGRWNSCGQRRYVADEYVLGPVTPSASSQDRPVSHAVSEHGTIDMLRARYVANPLQQALQCYEGPAARARNSQHHKATNRAPSNQSNYSTAREKLLHP